MVLITAGTSGESLPSKCYVKTHLITTTINCPNANLTSLPSRLPRLVGKVCLQQNLIRTIPDLSGLAFVHKLNFSQNLLTAFPWTSLRNMTMLVTLDLSHNQLTTVRLDLSINVLRSLRHVHLEYNKLATFSQANLGVSLRGAKFSGHRFIQGNPLLCDCRMTWLAGMARAFQQCWPGCTAAVKNSVLFHSFVFSDALRCDSPDTMKGVPLHSVNLSACSAAQGTITTKSYLKITTINSNATPVIAVSSSHEERNQTATGNQTDQPARAKTVVQNTAVITTSLICIIFLGIWLALRRWVL
ncbi:SLIT2 [Branchiostoma lanceolatum]|uniref:SLIT2 protein n=1 Tax=Branchiostoma lanceolatum TaxID=7740 RepID=A0A8J9Z229_BRALA|nr:SLIT2 [Branchiostoma lanceolatum]